MSASKLTLEHHEAITAYIAELNLQHSTPKPTEHSYRPALAQLLKSLLPHLNPSNEQGRTDCGAPDFVLLRRKDNIPVAYVEAKDIGDPDLEGTKGNKEQFNRYKSGLDNIIFADHLDFVFYKKPQIIDSVRIAEVKNKKIVPIKDNFEKFLWLLAAFGDASPQTITSPTKLAKIMADKAQYMAEVFEKSLSCQNGDSTLTGQMEAFKSYLIHDLTHKDFADLYAQTIAYGMFAARIHDQESSGFSREKAAKLIPKTNPFLRNLFHTIAGLDVHDDISWIMDDLAEAFRATDIQAVLDGIGQSSLHIDPLIHFYEDFLSEYDPKLRKNRGVWYTPMPVVKFIVQAVDEILKTDFNIPKGIADSSKIKIKPDKNTMLDVHKVQILDPGTGTGTFLAEAVLQIKEQFKDQAGAWQDYVEQHLIPRLNGFEILMAPYAMAHLKLDRLLAETGYQHRGNQRLRIFLTNSLEEHHPDTGTLFAQFLANEAREANSVKKDCPVMVVMGNPPYSGESWNKGEWIASKMEDYKKEPGTNIRLQERNSKWINDDYVKFIRLGQHFVDKNNSGILAYIANHGFIDNPTFRGMRWHLMSSFDKIYIIDLHGNTKKKETAPDGSKDENVFDIQQGVSINIFVKTGQKKKGELADVYHHDLYGLRQAKYGYLQKAKFADIPFAKLQPAKPEYFFVPRDYRGKKGYDSGFSVAELFPVNSVGIVTARDEFTIHESEDAVRNVIKDFLSITDEEAREKYNLGKDVRDWSVAGARRDLQTAEHNIVPIAYRPFDTRYTSYSGKTKGFHCMPRKDVMQHFLLGENIGLALCKQFKTGNEYYHALVSSNIIESSFVSNRTSEITSLFPLYLYYNENGITRTPNLNPEIVARISKCINLEFEPEKTRSKHKFAPINLLDYVYAVLHSPSYREKYKEFLKIDFPRLPFPADARAFHRLAKLGAELRLLHLMEHSALDKLSTAYPIAGSNRVDKLRWELSEDSSVGRVWINESQYFDKVPLGAWEFYIGGYQPSQKWLKDRKGRALTFEDIEYYQKIIKVLVMMNAIQQEVDHG
jgi:hypothetical protein